MIGRIHNVIYVQGSNGFINATMIIELSTNQF
jgi:hypothetical protein